MTGVALKRSAVYFGAMPTPKRRRPTRKPNDAARAGAGHGPVSATKTLPPNRIKALAKQKQLTYSAIAQSAGAHVQTIQKLANNEMQLTLYWMQVLGDVFGVPPAELISESPTAGLRMVRVTRRFESDTWSLDGDLPEQDQFEVFVPDDATLRSLNLYAGEMRGNAMNLRYRDGTIIVLSKLTQKPNEILEGKRYHVRLTRADGARQDTIATLVKDEASQYWLKPESSEPRFRSIPLEGENVQLIGRVRYIITAEE